MNKNQFTLKDLHGCGQYIILDRGDNYYSTSYLSSIMFKVGYSMTPIGYCLIHISDGLILNGYLNAGKFKPFVTKEDLLEYINSNTHGQKYRKATQEEVVRVILHQKHRTA